MTLDDLHGRAVCTLAEAGALLGISTRTAHRCADRGEIPTIWLGRRRLVPIPQLFAVLGRELVVPQPLSPGPQDGDVA